MKIYCQLCGTLFVHDPSVLEKVSPVIDGRKILFPDPVHCPDCRMRQRLVFRNERFLYLRECDFSKRKVVSFYSLEYPGKIYEPEAWWGDRWDGLAEGRPFDFSKTFAEQFAELRLRVPRMSLMISHCENSDYAPYSVGSKNLYLCVSCVGSEDVLYSYQANASHDCTDCSIVFRSTLCYECLYGVGLYHCFWTQDCKDSQDLYFCRDCRNCTNCIGCANLTNKKFHVFNQPVSESEYREYIEKFRDQVFLEAMKKKFDLFSAQNFFRSSHNFFCENSSGDHLLNCKNTIHCFEAENLEDCAYVYNLPQGAKNCYDVHYSPKSELVYEAVSAVNAYHSGFVLSCWDVKETWYSEECFYSKNLFCCIGLKNAEYCILNRKYSKEEYEKMVARIIEHMRKTGEFGKFFQPSHSPFAYNETLAQEFFPLTKEGVLQRNLKWKDPPLKDYVSQNYRIPSDIREVSDDILKEILACSSCGKNFRIITKELKFYRKMSLAVPRKCPDCRYSERMRLRVGRKLVKSHCAKCGKRMVTSLRLLEGERVYCDDCYLRETV